MSSRKSFAIFCRYSEQREKNGRKYAHCRWYWDRAVSGNCVLCTEDEVRDLYNLLIVCVCARCCCWLIFSTGDIKYDANRIYPMFLPGSLYPRSIQYCLKSPFGTLNPWHRNSKPFCTLTSSSIINDSPSQIISMPRDSSHFLAFT